MSSASKNVKDVMISFANHTLKRIDAYCDRTGLKRSTAVMQAVDRYLAAPGAAFGAEPEPHPAAKGTESLVKTKLRRRR